MTAELWLVKPCKHGHLGAHEGWPSDAKVWGDYIDCEGGSSMRLDPDKVVFRGFTIGSEYVGGTTPSLTVQDVIDALEEEEESRPPDAWVCPRCGAWEMEGEKFPNCSECGMAYRKPALDQEEE